MSFSNKVVPKHNPFLSEPKSPTSSNASLFGSFFKRKNSRSNRNSHANIVVVSRQDKIRIADFRRFPSHGSDSSAPRLQRNMSQRSAKTMGNFSSWRRRRSTTHCWTPPSSFWGHPGRAPASWAAGPHVTVYYTYTFELIGEQPSLARAILIALQSMYNTYLLININGIDQTRIFERIFLEGGALHVFLCIPYILHYIL